jgi:HrpA-like RNA helicase
VLCGVLVAAGTALARLPVDPMYGKVLLAGAAAGCAVEVMQLVAMVSSENLFFNPRWEPAGVGGGGCEIFRAWHCAVLQISAFKQCQGAGDGTCSKLLDRGGGHRGHCWAARRTMLVIPPHLH